MTEQTHGDELIALAEPLRADGMRCNCDLDNWEPERSTGHSWVCRIHKAALRAHSQGGNND